MWAEWTDEHGAVWGDRFFKSEDGGETWISMTPGNKTGWGGPLEAEYLKDGGYSWIQEKAIHWCGAMVIDPRDSNKVLVTSGNGVFACDNTWDETPQFYFDPTGIEEVVALDMVSVPGGDEYSAIGDYDGFIHTDVSVPGEQYQPNIGSTSAIAYCPAALFNQMNSGEVRVLLGSTAKCGAGMNSQQKMIALHHLDAPLRPSDMEQRNGRIERQGNENPEVDIFRYVTDKSFDAYLYQILENKQRFISQIMTSKTPERTCADIDEQALDYAEVKALCAGNPLIKREMELQAQIKDLKMEKARYNENIYELQDNIRVKYPNEIKQSELIIKHFTADITTANSAPKAIDEEGKVSYPLKMGDKVYPTRKEAGEAFKEALNKNLGAIMSGKEIMLGEYRGMQLSIMYNDFRKMPQACLKGEKAHYCDLNIETTTGNIIRLDNAINSIQKTIDDLTAKVETKKGELEQMKIDVEKPFEKEQELAAAEAELEDVHVKLTQFELTDDSAQRDMFERFVDDFTEVLTGEKSYVKYESNFEAFMPLHVEMNSDILTIAQTTVQNGDLMYDPRIDFKVDYENKKVIPLNFENSFQGVYEEYDISDGKPETMKLINDILAFADDWMDEIEVQGYSPVTGDEEIQQTKDNISR